MSELTQAEQWRRCVKYAAYAVSDRGRVARLTAGPSTRAGRLLKPWLDRNGYARVRLDGLWRGIHLLVLDAFVGPAPEAHEIDHINGVRSDNHLSNLEYVTKSENQKRAAVMRAQRRHDARAAKEAALGER